MVRYLARRLLSGLLVLFIFLNLVFVVLQVANPGDYVSQYTFMPIEQKEALRVELGLNLPMWQRYLKWLGDLARGDLGHSYSPAGLGPPITDMVKSLIPPTLLVFGIGTTLAFLIGRWLGEVLAWHKKGPLTAGGTLASVLLYTSFPPWLAFLLTFFAVDKLEWLLRSFPDRLWRTAPLSQPDVMMMMVVRLALVVLGLLIVNALLYRLSRRRIPTAAFVLLAAALWVVTWYFTDWRELALNIAQRAALPLAAFTLLSFGEIMLIMRTSMEDTLHEQFVFTARAKGLPPRAIRQRHAARNALIPVVSRLVTSIPYLLTGMVMIEGALDWHGIGSAMFDAFLNENMPFVTGMILLIGVFSLSIRLILDVLVAVLDPRVRSA